MSPVSEMIRSPQMPHRRHIAGSFRKNGKTPFIVHPQRVAERVKFFGGDHIGIIAAWLHDVIEDCDEGDHIVRDTLRQLGLPQHECDEILAIVLALTKDDTIEGKADRLADTLERIKQAPPRQSWSSCATGWITWAMHRTGERSSCPCISP